MAMKYTPHALAFALAASASEGIAHGGHLVPTHNFESVRARVIDDTPSRFTVDLGFIRNLGVDRGAPYIALYDQSSKPSMCADFRHITMRGQNIGGNKRRYNLSGQPELLQAMRDHRCVVVPNNG